MATPSHSVQVRLGARQYDIDIGPGQLARLAEFLAARTRITHAVLITDSHVEPLHGRRAADLLAEAQIEVDVAIVEAGEPSKDAQTAAELWNAMLQGGADRKSVVVAVGGGVIGDLAGFVASTFARGVPLVQVPTTLLAQVDSSVGGKVGINLPGAKNMVGAFWQPLGVLIDTATLDSLPEREYRSGLAEVVKYGVILDADFFAYLEKNADRLLLKETEPVAKIVARSCRLKADVIAQDEREETGHRAILNYGHTFAHALEAVSGYGHYLHGEAVALGMACAARLACRMGRVSEQFVERQNALLTAMGLPISFSDLNEDALLEAMQHDKKTEHGRLRFVLPTRLGHVELVSDVAEDDVRAALTD